jgi:hypothetical protein
MLHIQFDAVIEQVWVAIGGEHHANLGSVIIQVLKFAWKL